MRRQSVARLMPGSLAAAFFPSVCRRFQDGSLEAEHRFAFPDDVRETAAAGVLRQGFHPARPSPRGSGHPADQLAFSAFMSNSMSWSSVNATICTTTATFPSTGTGPVKFAISVQAPARTGSADRILARRQDFRALPVPQAVRERGVLGHLAADAAPVRACPADAIALGAHEHDFHVQQLGQRRQAVPHRAPAGEDR